MAHEVPDTDDERRQRHTAGAFDIRNIIGALLGLYGLVLTVLGLVSDDTGERTGDLDANLWAGIGMLVVAVSFLVWARLRPILVKSTPESRSEPADAGRSPGL